MRVKEKMENNCEETNAFINGWIGNKEFRSDLQIDIKLWE